MKIVLILIVVGVVALGLVYKYGGYATFDPTAQGREAKAKIKPGMSLKQVVDAAGPNGKYHTVTVRKEKIRGEEQISTVKGPPRQFELNALSTRVANKEFPNGFTVEYYFSDQAAFEVEFDSTGTVVDVADVQTMADLLQTREH